MTIITDVIPLLESRMVTEFKSSLYQDHVLMLVLLEIGIYKERYKG